MLTCLKRSSLPFLIVLLFGSVPCFALTGSFNRLGLPQNGQAVRNQGLPADTTIVHTVKKGETLYSISTEYGVNVASIKKWNHLKSNLIHVGEKLKIFPQKAAATPEVHSNHANTKPGEYVVKPGNTLFSISQKYDISVEKLKALNNLTSNVIRVGQTLIVKPTGSHNTADKAKKSFKAYGKFMSYAVKKTMSLDTLLAKFRMGKGEFRALNPNVSDTLFHKGNRVKVLVPPAKTRKNPYLAQQSMVKLGLRKVTTYKPNAFGVTTNGELYNPKALTAGSPTLSIGALIFVKNLKNGRAVLVRINDRTSRQGLKLSKAAWQALKLTGSNPQVMVYRVHE